MSALANALVWTASRRWLPFRVRCWALAFTIRAARVDSQAYGERVAGSASSCRVPSRD